MKGAKRFVQNRDICLLDLELLVPTRLTLFGGSAWEEIKHLTLNNKSHQD